MVGVYSGAVTNTPALGAASQMIRDMSVALADKGYDPLATGFNELLVPSAYAMAYPFGVCGNFGHHYHYPPYLPHQY